MLLIGLKYISNYSINMKFKITLSFFLLSFLWNQDCLGGELRTLDSFLYGRFEVNMKSAEGDGYVSSFFTYHDHWGESSSDEWSLLTNEIDIEMTGNHNSSVQFTTHHPGSPNSWSYSEIIEVPFNPHSEFHDYAIEWTPYSIKWFIDDLEVYSQGQNLVDDLIYSQKIMMNLWSAIWEDWVGPWNPSTMPVMAYYNHVKYYEYTPGYGDYGSDNNFTLSWIDEFDSFDSSRWEEAVHGFSSNNCQFDPLNVLFHNDQMILIVSDSSYILGDVNDDLSIDILDIVSILDIVIYSGDVINTADYNQDSEINVIDIVQIVSSILDR